MRQKTASRFNITAILLFLLFVGGVIWWSIQSVTTQSFVPPHLVEQRRHVVVIGDSISFGHRDCTTNGQFDISACKIEKNTYGYLFARDTMADGGTFSNLAYSGSTATCSHDCTKSATDYPADPNGFRNKFSSPMITLPEDPSAISNSSLVFSEASGERRANTGEFSNLTNTTVLVAYGRNDVNRPPISLKDFINAYQHTLNGLPDSNEIIALTVFPQTDSFWRIVANDITLYKKVGNNPHLSTLQQLDHAFSAEIWKLAATKHAQVAPIHEYFFFHPSQDYFSSDGLHPSAAGHLEIEKILLQHTSPVIETDISDFADKTISIQSTEETYGEILTEKPDGSFVSAQPFMSTKEKPYTLLVPTSKTIIFSNHPVVMYLHS